MVHKYRILVVEDDPFIRKVLQHTLGSHFEVITQKNGLEAQLWLEQGNRADLLLTDLQMPQMSGQELVHHIRADSFYRTMPILIISALDDSQTRIRCLELGADDYLTKPFNPLEVKAKITAVLRRIDQRSWSPVTLPPSLGSHRA